MTMIFLPLKNLFLACFLTCSLIYVQAQPYYFRHYQVENGLSYNSVFSSLQDKDGFMWFGTRDGLNRFDGYTFKIFRHRADDPKSIGNNFIYTIYQDNGGTLWVGTQKGLYRYNAREENFTLLKGTENKGVGKLLADKSGNLWMLLGHVLCKYDLEKDTIRTYSKDHYTTVSSMCITHDGTLWASSVNGYLNKYNPVTDSFESFNVFSSSSTPSSTWINCIFDTKQNAILIGTGARGIKLFNTKTNTYKNVLTYNSEKTGILVRDFTQRSANEYWIATESGIFIYDIATEKITNIRKQHNNPYSLSDNAVYTLTTDKEGGVWAGTYFGGINYYPRQYMLFEKYFPDNSDNAIQGDVVREIHKDQSGNLWVGTEDAGLNRINVKTKKITHFYPTGKPGSIAYTNIHALLSDDHELWVGTYEHGIDIIDINTNKVIRHYDAGQGANDLKSNFIVTIYKTKNNNIYIGTLEGLYKYNRRTDDFTRINYVPSNSFVYAILEDENNNIWVGTLGSGLFFFNPGNGRSGHFSGKGSNNNSICSDIINSIFEDSRRLLWLGTEGSGLCCYDPSKGIFKHYTTEEGFPSNIVFKVLEDDNKDLWVTTSRGLVCFNPDQNKIKIFTKANGLLSDQFNYNSAYKDETGKMYFGSSKGMIAFDPKNFISNNFVAPVFITGFQVHNQEVRVDPKNPPLKESLSYTKDITLKYDQSTFSIDFAALSFTAPEMTEYKYIMEGLDRNWTYLKTNRKVYFTELAPGDYVFKVATANNDSSLNAGITTLKISIRPPFWKSSWAYLLYFLSGAAIVLYLIRNYHKRTEEKNRRKIEILEHKKEKEVYHSKIEFFTNVAHEIKTPLTLIVNPLEKVVKHSGKVPELKNSLRIMTKNANRLLELTDQLLDFRKTEITGFSLNFVRTNISALLLEIFNSFNSIAQQKGLSYILELPETKIYAYVDKEAFTKILTNIINNAVKYAGHSIIISLHPAGEEDKTFCITSKNDGSLISYDLREKIFEPFFRIRETEKQKGTGIGLSLSRSLAELHKGTLQLSSPENDLNVFTLILPIHQEFEFNL